MPKASRIPEDGWYDQMRRAFGACQFKEAGEIFDHAVELGSSVSVEAQLLQARVLLKVDENKAVAFLIRNRPRNAGKRLEGIWEMLVGVGRARMHDYLTSDQHFQKADKLLTQLSDRAELEYQQARRFLLEGDIDNAWTRYEAAILDTSRPAKIRNELLRSFIYSHAEQYLEQSQSLLTAISLIGKERQTYLEDWIHAVQNLAVLGRELPLEEGAAVARSSVDADQIWPSDFDLQRFVALKAVGWTCALQGDMLGCFRYLRSAEAVAPNEAFRAILALDRAYFAQIIGEHHWSEDEIAKAEALADRVDWNATSGDERIGLLLLADVLAGSNLEKATFYLARYKGLDRIRSPLQLFAFDKRTEAYAAYAEGVVQLAGRAEAATETLLRKAWVIFDRIGYDWRAGRTALRLYESTGKDRWLHLAEDKIEPYPRSWLATEMQHVKTPPRSSPTKLPRMQAKVFEMLCRQLSTAQIASELGLSPHTVRNHLKAVFKAYGVNTQAALVAEAARRGEIPTR
jgi:DNA-binding CsgD family transcriptional regulator